VHARRARLHGLFGFLTVVFVAVLVRGYGAGVWVVVLFGALLAGTYMFDRAELAQACEAMGWRFVGVRQELLPL
jgi:hypothetical protein